ncbi:MAG: hypothetical protein IH987_14405 [Planctomycetes bacterium]|nr:hypothetical protein [Planctomycetota bacterium]
MSTKTSLTFALAIGAAIGWLPAAQAYTACQLPDQNQNGAPGTPFVGSDTWEQNPLLHAENVSVAVEVSVARVRWWGTYVDALTPVECLAPAGDDFQIRWYENDGLDGLPGTLIHSSLVGDVNRQATGLFIEDINPHTEYQYEADLDEPVLLTPETGYWLSIQAINAFPGQECYWAWETAPAENQAALWRSATGEWETTTYDLAYCLFGETTIPALSTWGAVALALLLMVAGTVVFRRKATA